MRWVKVFYPQNQQQVVEEFKKWTKENAGNRMISAIKLLMEIAKYQKVFIDVRERMNEMEEKMDEIEDKLDGKKKRKKPSTFGKSKKGKEEKE